MSGWTRTAVRRGDVTLSCLCAGDGPDTVVLLHGLAGSAAEMLPGAAALLSGRHDDSPVPPERSRGTPRVIAIDQRGHGHSTRRPDDLSREAYVGDVVAVVDALAGRRPVTLVGQSMGAHTAMLVAAARPDLVRSLVMAEGGVGGDGDYPARLGEWFASWPVPFPDEDAAVTWLGGTPLARAWAAGLERRPDGLRPRFDADVMEAAIRAVAETARWAEWRRVSAPTLLVAGEHGTMDAAETARMRALRPEIRYEVVPGAGHDVHLDRPDAWAALLRSAVA